MDVQVMALVVIAVSIAVILITIVVAIKGGNGVNAISSSMIVISIIALIASAYMYVTNSNDNKSSKPGELKIQEENLVNSSKPSALNSSDNSATNDSSNDESSNVVESTDSTDNNSSTSDSSNSVSTEKALKSNQSLAKKSQKSFETALSNVFGYLGSYNNPVITKLDEYFGEQSTEQFENKNVMFNLANQLNVTSESGQMYYGDGGTTQGNIKTAAPGDAYSIDGQITFTDKSTDKAASNLAKFSYTAGSINKKVIVAYTVNSKGKIASTTVSY